MILHGEGFETFALADDRDVLLDLYDFFHTIGQTDCEIVAGRNSGQALSISQDDSSPASDGWGWGFPISGITSDATLIRGFAIKPVGYPAVTWPLFGLWDSESDILCTFAMTSTGAIQFYRGDLSGTLLDGSAAGTLTENDWNYVEFKVTLNDSTGFYQCRVDETNEFEGNGFDTTAGGTRAYQVFHGAPRSGTGAWIYDDAVLLDTQAGATGNEAVDLIGDVFLERVAPNANDTNNWTPSSAVDHFTLLNEDGEDGDTSYIESNTAAQQELNGYEDATGGNIILGVLARPVIRKTDAGSRQYKLLAESNGTVGKSDPYYPSTDYQRLSHVWETDPDTGIAWTVDGFNAATFGIEMFA